MEIKSYAKINLDLYVGKKDSDNYHDINSIFVKIDLYDTIFINVLESSETSINIDCKNVKNEDNLVYKVCKSYLDKYNIKAKIDVKIEKNIPLKTGLAAGSSNASSVLLYLNSIYKKASLETLCSLIYPISSDSVFFLYNVNAAIVSNKGKKVEKIDIKKQEGYLFFNLIQKKSTKEAYSLLDEKQKEFKTREKDYFKKDINLWKLNNDFSLIYDLKDIKNKYEKLNYLVSLSGSGSTIFLLCKENSVKLSDENVKKFKFL